MRVVHAWFGARKDRESNFHHRGGAVKHMQACLSACMDGESSFQDYGGIVKLVQAHFIARKRARKQFSSLWGC